MDGFGGKMASQLRTYAHHDTGEEERMIQTARGYVLGKDREDVVHRLYGQKKLGFTRLDLEASYDMAEQFEDTSLATPNTAWGFVHGLTRYSQTRSYADERSRLDRAGGEILSMVAGGVASAN